MRGRSRLVFAILLVLTAMTLFATTDALPQAVATHFGANDLADGWMSRDRYLVFMLSFSLGLPLALFLAALALWGLALLRGLRKARLP